MNPTKTLLPLGALFALGTAAQAGALAGSLFYGGDPNLVNGLTSERDTEVPWSWTVDDFELTKETTVTSVYGRFASDIARVTEFDWLILKKEFSGFVTVESGTSAKGTWTADTFDLTAAYKGYLGVVATDFTLAAGKYWLGLRPVGSGQGRAFLQQTGGTSAVGTPTGNGNSFVRSDFFGFQWEDVSVYAGETTDFSLGIVPEPGLLAALAAGLGLAASRRRATGGRA